ncbi:MAG TPA: 4-alpha-glucanotransferase [Burkholderiaceae bacterium]|nr:4-alpha-glucanotransferase [Burkholderiaceae bacterium]HMX10192.1 4-alpha-glucanotransferase [Burkholderiaceae bacterium]HMY98969.1 4-alpha-glucanotransferase [Burkholderiaceae bacterium]HNB44423.1 4-alpha-glucanotransferase [Burkholderiaceae bacterium]HNG79254.1 4-alpha-glucanotransferase [Burkholderiaceae bacterium]
MRFPRSSGVLLHPTSLPGAHGSGDLGASARHFVDWLAAGGQSLWQVLPLGGIGPGNSPYMSSSAFAGNLLLVDLDELLQRGWLRADDLAQPPSPADPHRLDFAAVLPWRMSRLALAAERFQRDASPEDRSAHDAFCTAHADWLEDHALFMALAEAQPGLDWCDWPAPLARRDSAALADARRVHAGRIAFWRFGQWCFFRQWAALRAYASERQVRIVGDMPIFIAHQSAEVWARPDLFELDGAGRPTVVAGVPPDLFAETGQRWGNPLYRWLAHAAEGYRWWIERVRRSFELVDILRIDHFRGFAGYWEIPASEPTAMRGRWVPGPAAALFQAITGALGELPIIAEDLGVITPDVEALRIAFGYPGMRILQFAWGEGADGGGAETRFLPHQYLPDCVVYTGSHDNDTTLGWWQSAPESTRHHLREYLASDGRAPHWDLMRAASASVADLAIQPMQDVLGLGSEHRMNFPGTPTGNWSWRFTWDQVPPEAAARLHRMAALYGRLPRPVAPATANG